MNDVIEQIKSVNLVEHIKRQGVRFNGSDSAYCPFHEDKNPSLSIHQKGDVWLWKCFSDKHDPSLNGGTIIDWEKNYGIDEAEAIDKIKKEYNIQDEIKPRKKIIEAEYIYHDKDGKESYRKIRYKGKKFVIKPKGKKQIPYRLPELLKNKETWLSEGEKDCDKLRELNIPATTTGGVNSWKKEFAPYFKDKKVIICLDAGTQEYMKKIAEDLVGIAKEVKITDLQKYGLGEDEDISDYIESSTAEDKEQLRKAVLQLAKEAPVYGKKSNLIYLSDVQSEPITWLWYNRFPEGKLSLLVGDPDTGKGILSAFMSGVFTKGKNWPDGERNDKSGSVIFMSTEDNINDTIRPRMEAAGADLNRVAMLKVEELTMSNVVKELKESKKEMEDLGLVFIDSINSYMGGVKGNDEISVRTALAPLIEFAGENKITVIGISHLNKDQAKKAIYRPTGSLAYVAIPRSVYVIQRDPEDKEEKRRRKFMPLKSNLSINPTSLAFKIEGPMGFPRIVFESDPIEANPDDEIGTEEMKNEAAASAQAKHFIKEALKNGRVESRKFWKWAKEENLASATINRVKDSIAISYKEGSEWYWELIK